MVNNKPTKHHYVPQFYLKGFYDRTNSKLHVYDRLNQRYSRPLPSKSIAFEAGYYFVENEAGKESIEVERALGVIETKAQPVIDKLIRGADIGREERMALAAFIALQSQRVPHTEKRFRETSQMAGLALMREAAQRGYFSSNFRDKVATGETPFSDPQDIDAYIIKAIDDGRITQTMHKNNVIRFMLDFAAELEVGYFNNDWTILEAPTGSAFITSDNPVGNVGKGFLGPETIRVFPLNYSTAVVIGHQGKPVDFRRKATKKEVKAVNNTIAERSDRYIISSNEELLQNIVKRTRTATISNEPLSKISVFRTLDSTLFRLEPTGPDSQG